MFVRITGLLFQSRSNLQYGFGIWTFRLLLLPRAYTFGLVTILLVVLRRLMILIASGRMSSVSVAIVRVSLDVLITISAAAASRAR